MFSGVDPFVHFGRGYFEDQLIEIILNWPVVQDENMFKRFLIWTSSGPHVRGAEPFMQI